MFVSVSVSVWLLVLPPVTVELAMAGAVPPAVPEVDAPVVTG